MEFYIDARRWGNNILYRGIKNGRHEIAKIPFKPTLFLKSKKPTSGWTSLYGDPLEPIKFDSINEAKDYVKRYEDVSGYEVHGMTDYQYQFISESFQGDITYNIDQMRILFLDLEVVDVVNTGFPDIQSASTPIVLISVADKASGVTIVFGSKPYTKDADDSFEFRLFPDEMSMLKAFISYWRSDFPDIVSGWNTDQFDFPYLINRIRRLLDDEAVKELSPFGVVQEKGVEIRGKEIQTYEIVGVVQLDYLELYKKFTYSSRESYALGFIAKEELGESKLEIASDSFQDSYINHYQQFVKYNAIDSQLVAKLDVKMRLLDLIISTAYLVKCNIRDIFGPVKTWDVFIYNHLLHKKIAVPPRTNKVSASFEGAWVKEPVPGMYGWVVSFDFASLYPTIIRQWNLSPETLIKHAREDLCVNDLINTEEGLSKTAFKHNYSIAANGSMYSHHKKGILPELMEYLMVDRKVSKKQMLKLEQQYQDTHDSSLLAGISALNNRQMALKILANSGYGAITNAGFRYFDLRIGEAITLTGQASDRHVEKQLNIYMNKILKTEGVDYVIAGDTDSLYLNMGPLVDKLCKDAPIEKIIEFLDKVSAQIQKDVIQKSIDHIFSLCNCFEKLMDMKREAISSKAIWTAKKRYAMVVHDSEGVKYDPPKLKIMGMDIIKSSTPQVIRKELKSTLPIIFDKGQAALRTFVGDVKTRFMSMPVQDISFPRGTSDIEKWVDGAGYKSRVPIHIRGAIVYNNAVKHLKKYDRLQSGDKIKFCYLKTPNPVKENVISFPSSGTLPPELGLERYIDYETQFQKSFLSPLEGITTAIGFTLEDVSNFDALFE